MKRIFSFFAAIALAATAFAQQSQPIPIDPAVKIGKLDNGLTYYIRHNEEPKGQANFYIAQKVGSILEDEEQRGLAHFLEHMCFNGTEHFPGNGVIKYCESIGVKFGANLNAYTSIDETVYNIDNVPVANVPSSIDSCLWILHDWADGLLLTNDDIDHERGVIHEEWRTRSDAQIRMLEKILPEIFPDGNRYGHRLPIGLMSVVDNFPYQVLRDYYEKWYRPDQQGIVVVGDIDVNEIEAKVKDIFGTIARTENPAERYYVQIPDNAEPIISLAKDKEQAYAVSFIFCKHDAYPVELRGDLNYLVYQYALDAAAIMVQARIDEILQKPGAPFIQAAIGDGETLIAKTKSSWQASVVSSENDLSNAVTSIYREMLRCTRNGFTASEYERAKARIMANLESELKSKDKKKSAAYCKEYVRHFIDNEPIPGIDNEFALIQQISSIIPVEAINQIIASLKTEGNLVVCAMLPDKEGVVYPSEEELAAQLKAVEAETIEPYVDAVSDEPLMAELPAAGKIVKTKADKLGYTKFILSNGATVYFKQTDFNKDEVIFAANSFGGSSLYSSEADINSFKAINEVVSVGGVGNFSMTELMKVLAGKKVSLTPKISFFKESIRGKSTPKDLETLFQLNYLSFTALRSDNEAFESWRERSKAAVANREIDPMSSFQDSTLTNVYCDGFRGIALKSNQYDELDYNHILSLARERFANAADFTFIITGAVPQDTIVPLIERYIASLPSTGKHEKSDAGVLKYRNGKNSLEYERGMEVPMVTNMFFDSGKAKYNLKNQLSYELALNALSVVLLEEIREKEGGTYGIGAYGSLDGFPRQEAQVQIAYQTNPEKYEYLNGRVREIVADFAANGPSEENLAKGKEYMLKTHGENIHENSYWSGTLDNLLETGIDISKDYEEVLKSITAEDVRKIFEKVIKQNNHTEVIMVGKAK